MLIGLGENKNVIDMGDTRLKVTVTRYTVVKHDIFAHYLENYYSQIFHVFHGFSENTTCIDFRFTLLKVKATRVNV